MSKKYLVHFIFSLTFSLVLNAQETPEFRFGYEAYLYGENQKFADSVINPGNQILNIPEISYTFDQRAEFKWLLSDAKIILRPRIESINKKNTEDKNEIKHYLNLTDFFVEQQISDELSTTLGLQVYQWGAAELLNPTNPFFHFNTNQRSLVYKEKGHALVRLNWSVSKENNFVFIAEPISNNEQYWIAEKKFKPQFAVKFETAWPNSRHFVGVVAGRPDDADYFIGEYGQYEFLDGVSFYVDIKHSMNKFFYTPYQDGFFHRFEVTDQKNQFSTLGAGGLRYEGDFDLRVEYIYNSVGYDQAQFDEALVASAQLSPFLVENLQRFQKSGLELLTKDYVYVSFRKSDPFEIKDFNIYLRSINSVLDLSAVEQFEFDKSVSDHFSVFGQYSFYVGDQDTEFKLLNDWKAALGLKGVY